MDSEKKFQCECNNKFYASQKSLEMHKKTSFHRTNMATKDNPIQLALTYKCECTNKEYSSKTTYNNHLKSAKHQFWDLKKEMKKLKEELTRKEIELGKKEGRIQMLEDSNLALLNELSTVRKEERRRRKRKKKSNKKSVHIRDID